MHVTEEHYLAFDRAAEFCHEFLDGEIVLRPGANVRHAILRMNLIGELHSPFAAQLTKFSGLIFGFESRLACTHTPTLRLSVEGPR